MLSLNLAPLFKARGINKPYTFLIKAGFTAHIASNLITNKTAGISLKHIGVLCTILICEPNDLFLWTPDDKRPLSSNHPLLNIGAKETVKNFQDIISTMPIKKINELTEALANKTDL